MPQKAGKTITDERVLVVVLFSLLAASILLILSSFNN